MLRLCRDCMYVIHIVFVDGLVPVSTRALFQCKDCPFRTIDKIALKIIVCKFASILSRRGWVEQMARAWRRHQMETFSALLALCVGNSLVTGEFPSKRPVARSSEVFFGLRLNKQLSKQSQGWWFEMPSCSLWCHCYLHLSLWWWWPL